MLLTPISLTPVKSDTLRDITPHEKYRYQELREHYAYMCSQFPCNRKYKSHYDWLVGILSTGKIATL